MEWLKVIDDQVVAGRSHEVEKHTERRGKQAYHSLSSCKRQVGYLHESLKRGETRLVNECTCQREAAWW